MSLEARMDKVERQLNATHKLVQTGMKLLVRMEKQQHEFQNETQQAINALIAAQMRTEVKLDRLISAMGRNGSNGHKR